MPMSDILRRLKEKMNNTYGVGDSQLRGRAPIWVFLASLAKLGVKAVRGRSGD